jgi:hypothetical protein
MSPVAASIRRDGGGRVTTRDHLIDLAWFLMPTLLAVTALDLACFAVEWLG